MTNNILIFSECTVYQYRVGNAPLPFFYREFTISDKKVPAVAKRAYRIHSLAGQILQYAVPLHVAAAMAHYFRGHVIFARIVPFLRNTKN
jgi:cytochrome b561